MKISFVLGNILPSPRKVYLFVRVPSPSRGSPFFSSHCLNLCGPAWEVEGDKGESNEEKVNDIRQLKNEGEKLNEGEV